MPNPYIKDFPLLMNSTANGKRLVYLDNAATTQKPQSVIDAVSEYYRDTNANPHRGAYTLSSNSTEAYENARTAVARFINAATPNEIVFTRGTTEALNLVALSYGEQHVGEGDEILIAISEHHSNFLPWQELAKRKNASLSFINTDKDGRISLEEVRDKLNQRTKIVAVAQVSNVLGVINPIAEIARMAHEVGAVVVMDGAQSVPHIKVDVQALDVDFIAFSGHKMLAPAGIGVLYGKYKLLDAMRPVYYGGGIVEDADMCSARYYDAPTKFEAGTPNVEGAVGLHAAIDYLEQVGMDNIARIESELVAYALDKLRNVPHLTLYTGDESTDKTGIISFNIDDVHPHDVASILDADGVAVRAGHHCAAPLMKHMGINASCRMSMYFYNTTDDIDAFVAAVGKVRGVLGFES